MAVKTINDTLTVEQLRDALIYDPDTGLFRWLIRPRNHFKSQQAFKAWNSRYAGNVAGTADRRGYTTIRIFGMHQSLHRLAYLFMIGIWPDKTIDHINREKTDNSWKNLRKATHSQQSINQPLSSRNKSGYRGVCWCPYKLKWNARIKLENKQTNLGYFASKLDAHAAYCEAAIRLHGEFARFS